MKPFFARGLFYDVVFEPTAQADAATLLVWTAPVKPISPGGGDPAKHPTRARERRAERASRLRPGRS